MSHASYKYSWEGATDVGFGFRTHLVLGGVLHQAGLLSQVACSTFTQAQF